MVVLVGDTQYVYNAERVVRDSEAVIFDYEVLQYVKTRHRRHRYIRGLEITDLRICSVEYLHLSPEIHLFDLLE